MLGALAIGERMTLVPTEVLNPGDRSLDEIADSARGYAEEMRGVMGKLAVSWNQNVIGLGRDLIEARERHQDNQSFGAWLTSYNYFGFSQKWLHSIREAIEYASRTGFLTTTDSDELLSIKGLVKKSRKEKRDAEREAKRAETRALPAESRYQSHVTDISELHHKITGPVDVIITDPPYPKEYLWTFAELSRQAKGLLKPGGLCVAMSGQSYLPEVMEAMGSHLDYYWTAAYLLPGQPTPIRQRNVNASWKPLLIYSNGPAKPRIFGDVMRSDRNEKEWHDWGQSISGMLDIVDRLSEPGDLILDPFVGGGATAVAALELDRNIIVADVDPDEVALTDNRIGEWFDKA